MYVCGPTVYGDAHFGTCRPAITFDLLSATLPILGYKVRYVRNITDVGHLEHDADDGRQNSQESTTGTIGADGSSAILHQPLPQGNGSAERTFTQYRTARFRDIIEQIEAGERDPEEWLCLCQ